MSNIAENGKALVNSRIFWLAVMSLISVTIDGLFKINIDVETQEKIVSLDWGNIRTALFDGLFILARIFTSKSITSYF